LLLSQTISFPDGASLLFPTFNRLPRTGGALKQSGTVLTVGVGQRTSNTVQITEGATVTSVEWNGRQPQSVMASQAQAVLVQAAQSGHDHVTINLGASTALATASVSDPAPSTGQIREASLQVHAFRALRTSGTAVQTGTVLNVSVTSRKVNDVVISSSNLGQTVQVEWGNSGPRTFSGVSTIVVDIRNGVKDLVALDNTVAKGP
jgi:hypothetical protein